MENHIRDAAFAGELDHLLHQSLADTSLAPLPLNKDINDEALRPRPQNSTSWTRAWRHRVDLHPTPCNNGICCAGEPSDIQTLVHRFSEVARRGFEQGVVILRRERAHVRKHFATVSCDDGGFAGLRQPNMKFVHFSSLATARCAGRASSREPVSFTLPMAEEPKSREEERSVTYDPLIELMARFENVRAVDTSVDPFESLGIEDRLKKHIVDGIKKGLERDLEAALEQYPPLAIINDILLDGMKTVGELFGAGKMQLPFVLQSAEVMKSAVRFLEPLMDKVEGSDKGSILLATVAGDVHDIGKNLVDIILSNNGYRVVNIGIKQPINTIIEKTEEHGCQVIGLSGLLVKSTLIMRDNLLEMNERGLAGYPVILGGAALTRAYVEQDLRSLYEGSVFYAQDAFEGLSLMGGLCGEDREDVQARGRNDGLEDETTGERVASHRVGVVDPALYVFTGERSDVEAVDQPPTLPFYGDRKQTKFDIFEIYKYINPIAMFRGQWQFKRPEGMGNIEFTAWLDAQAGPIFARLTRELATRMKPRVKWGYFPCASEANDLIIFQEDAVTERMRYTFPRQRDGRRLCISDFFKPLSFGQRDVVGFSIVTIGDEVSAYERELFARGDFQDYLFVHGMGVETAEALAEYWHKQMRIELGIAADDPPEMKLLFSGKYRGSRYSFGYPACPNLEDQAKLFELLKPEDIGVELTEEFMLSPEQSTSAIVVHHPEAKYFNVR
jgi:5-methyltetrahydrofolate--homocysteine methyltransferase